MRFFWILSLALLPHTATASAGDGGIFIIAGTGISTRAYVQFYIENDIGQRTGQLPNGQRVAEIPGTEDCYGTSSSSDDDTGERGSENVEFQLSPFPGGQHKLVIVPLATTSYFLNMTIRNDNMSRARHNFEGFAVAGTTISYNFTFAPTASSPTPVAKVVTLPSLRQSVQVALQIGQLGDAAFVARLDKLLAKAQSDVVSGKNKQAADRLDQFIHRLDSAFKKEPDPDDGDDADDKKDASTMKRFVTKTAHDSLNEDARTLIIGLGEQPKK